MFFFAEEAQFSGIRVLQKATSVKDTLMTFRFAEFGRHLLFWILH